MSSPPIHPIPSTGLGYRRKDVAKVENNSELLIMNAELFAPNKSSSKKRKQD